MGSLSVLGGSDSSTVGEDEDLEDEEGEADEHKAEDLATLEGDLEAFEPIDVAKVGGLDVGGSSGHHADVAASHGGDGTDEESKGGVGEVVLVSIDELPGHVDGTEDNDSEESTEHSKSAVLFLEESFGTLRIIIFKLDIGLKQFERKRRVWLSISGIFL